MRKAVFLDRDGTIGGDGFYCHPDHFQFYPYAIEAIRLLNDHGYQVIVVTNQTHVAYGEITVDQIERSFLRLQEELATHGAHLDAWYMCPHGPNDGCTCRKPNTLLFELAQKEFDISFPESFVIGDSGSSDMRGAVATGCTPILVLTGLGQDSIGEYRKDWEDIEPAYVAENVFAAVKWILAN